MLQKTESKTQSCRCALAKHGDWIVYQYLLRQSEFVALTQLVFQVQGGSAAFQSSSLQEGDAVAQYFSLIQVVGGHDDGAI